jgi:hypothetical protein
VAHVRNTTYICTQQLPIPQHAAAKHGRLVTWLHMALWLPMAFSSLPLSSQGAMQRRTRRGVICTVLRREASRGALLPHHFCPHPVTALAARATFRHLSSLRLRSGARRRERGPVSGCLTTVGLPQSHRRQPQVSSWRARSTGIDRIPVGPRLSIPLRRLPTLLHLVDIETISSRARSGRERWRTRRALMLRSFRSVCMA